MKRTAVMLVLCAIVLLAMAPRAHGDARAVTDVMVRLYDAFGLPLAGLRTAERTAEAIFATAGVRIIWRECQRTDDAAAPPDPCDDARRPADVVVRMVTAPPVKGRRSLPLGYSVVDARMQIGALATVFADRVHLVAQRVGIDPGLLLGRTLAHEMGHLLLATPSHTAGGLMRAHWPDKMLRRHRDQDWVFAPHEVREIGRVLAVRAQRVPETSIAAVRHAQ